LSTESKEFDGNFFTKVIHGGAGSSWTARLENALEEVKTDYLIMLCDDYLLCDYVDVERIDVLIEKARIHEVGNLRMLPNPGTHQAFAGDLELRRFPKGIQYRISTQAGIWQKNYLKKFSTMDTSIWGFERLGSAISNQFDEEILCTHKHFFPFLDAVHKGKWENVALSMCERNNIPVDFTVRSRMGNLDYLKKHGKGVLAELAPILTTNIMNLGTMLKKVEKKLSRNTND
jgi:hypothetical protein